MPLELTIVASRFSRFFPVMRESVHSSIERSSLRDFAFSVESSFSSSASSSNFLTIFFCLGERACSFPGFSGVGNQNFSSLYSGRSTCIRPMIYVTTSSCSVWRLSAATSTGRIIFVSSGFSICSSATLVSAGLGLGKSVVLAICIATFLSQAVVIAGAIISFEHSSNCGRGWIVPVIE